MSRIKRGSVALLVGCLLNYLGDHLLGVRLELFQGLETFNTLWFLDIFILPFIVGGVVGMMYGLGGKWLCYFPPLIVRLYSYYEALKLPSYPDGASLMPMGWWGFFVILAIEAAAFGGIAGEILVKRTYGRKPVHLEYQDKAAQSKVKSEFDV
jgi:hypothetical protein